MPVTARIDRDNRRVYTSASGVLSKYEFIGHIQNTWGDGSIASFDELVDATTADASRLSADDLA